jgi:predicted permease
MWAGLSFRTEEMSMDGWGREFRLAVRGLLRRPGFTAVAVVTLALGIGANTAIFSVVNGVVFQPLPYPDSHELVSVTTEFPTMGFTGFWVSPPEFMELEERARSFESVGGFRTSEVSVGGGEQPERVTGAIATASLFETLGVAPRLGRVFDASEDVVNGPAVAVLSHELWTRSFGQDPDIVGRAIDVNGVSTQILGVMEPGFDLEDNGIEVWAPAGIDRSNFQNRGSHYLEVVARLRDGVTPISARRELASLVQSWGDDSAGAGHVPNPQTHPMAMEVLQEDVVGDVRAALLILLGVVGFVLLIASGNVANLLLARAEDRQREVSVRVALGAGRWRLVQQFLTEGLVLSTLGAVFGLGLAWASLQGLRMASPGDLPRLGEIGLDGTVLLVTTAVTVAVGIVFGLAPARHVLGATASTLRDGGTRTTAGRGGLRSLLIVTETALALVLAVGAGLMIRSFGQLTQVEPGFATENRIAFQLYLPATAYPSSAETSALYRQVIEGLEARPEFEGAWLTSSIPTVQTLAANDTQFESIQPTQDGPPQNVDFYTTVSAGYTEAAGIELLEGRRIEPSDDASGTPVLLVNQALADRFYPDRSVVGERIRPCCGNGPWYEVVGVVANVKQGGLDEESGTEIFMAEPQVGGRSLHVVAKTTGRAEASMAAAREVVGSIDGSLPLASLRTMETVVGDALARARFLTTLMASFAGLALLLAGIGTYSVMSYSVTQRSKEIGIRMAMGAKSGSVVRMVMGQGLRVAGLGLALGLVGAWLLTDVLESLLYNIEVWDTVSFVSGPILLAGVAVAACWLPALRATRVEPVIVLKEE